MSAPQVEIVLESVLIAVIFQNDVEKDVHNLNFNEKYKLGKKILSQHKLLLLTDIFELVNDPNLLEFLPKTPAPSKVIITSRDRVDGF